MEKEQMRALAAIAKGELRIVELDIPEPDDYEALVKNEGCVFCNSTDKMITDDLFHTPDYPVLIGHESLGKVIKVGKKVTKYKIGDRVICSNAIPSGYNKQYYSTWGGFAEYGIVGDLDAYISDNGTPNEKNAYRNRYTANDIIPYDLPTEKACLVFPLAEIASAIKQIGALEGKNAVIIGTGIVGYFFTYFARLYGVDNITVLGRRESRLAIAKELGADKTFIDTSEASEYIKKLSGADFVIECSGNPKVLEGGLPYLKEGGTLAIYAVPPSPYLFDMRKCPKNFTVKRIGPCVSEAIDEVSSLLRKDVIPIHIFLTHVRRFDEAATLFEEVRKGNVIKGLVKFENI